MTAPGDDDLAQRLARLEQTDHSLAQALEQLARREAPARRGRDWDAYAAVIATFIGLLALAVSGYTAYVQRQQLRAQVWPHLRIEFSTIDARYLVVNEGTGPARVTRVRVTAGGVVVRTWDAAKQLVGFGKDEGVILSSIDRAVLQAGKELTIVRPHDDDGSRGKFGELLPRGGHPVAMTICYCSVLDECWVAVTGNAADPVASDGCPIPDAERFTD